MAQINPTSHHHLHHHHHHHLHKFTLLEHQLLSEDEKSNLLHTSSLNATPSSEPFNIDPDLQSILSKNREIINQSKPRFVVYPKNFNYNNHDDNDNSSLIHIIQKRQLHKLGRFPESEELYFEAYNQIIKKKYHSSCHYLVKRLNFDNSRLVLDQTTKLPITHFSCPIGDYPNHPSPNYRDERQDPSPNLNPSDQSSHSKTTFGLVDGLDFRVIHNEWPYAIPKEYQHMIVWSRLPLIDLKLAKSPEESERARTLGLSGIENTTVELMEQLNRFNLNDDDNNQNDDYDDNHQENDEQDGLETGGKIAKQVGGIRWRDCQSTQPSSSSTTHHLNHPNSRSPSLDYQIRQFVRYRWPKNQGFYDTFWFLNPAYLQSCPELPHFHVFVKQKLK